MRESLEMVTASRMLNMVQICNICFNFLLNLFSRNVRKRPFEALGVESPHGGAMQIHMSISLRFRLRLELTDFDSLIHIQTQNSQTQKQTLVFSHAGSADLMLHSSHKR